jgi:hypothetical protein
MTRHFLVIFWDDIREEVGNKLSLMGVYLLTYLCRYYQ